MSYLCLVNLVLITNSQGLVLRKVFLHLVKVQQRRERYLKGIKALGEHMHVVTRRISIAPSTVQNNSDVSNPKPNRRENLRAPSRLIPNAGSPWDDRTLEIKYGQS